MTNARAERLRSLEQQAAQEMARVEALPSHWIGAREEVYPVVVCGAGLSGLSIAFALKRRGVPALVIDEREKGDEGPWSTARMATLRSPKFLSGPDIGVPSLTPRAWYEAVHGAAAWDALGRIERTEWIQYLRWFRKAAAVEVENRTRLLSIEPDDRRLALVLESAGGERRRIFCRRLVLATGIEGAGGAYVPDPVRALPKRLWAHSSETISMDSLRDKDVAVLGAAASGFDWAVEALRAGAASVTMPVRAPDLPRTEVLTWTNFPGLLGSFAEMPDSDRWRFARAYFRLKMPPTQDQYDRARAFPNFAMRLACPVLGFSVEGDRLRLALPGGAIAADRLLLGTGYAVDLAMRPELAAFAGAVAHWKDRFAPPSAEEDAFMSGHPYLGSGFELIPKRSGADDWISRVHLFNNAALVSLGPVSNGVTGLKYGVPRIADALLKALFREEAPRYLSALAAYCEPHFNPRLGEPIETAGLIP